MNTAPSTPLRCSTGFGLLGVFWALVVVAGRYAGGMDASGWTASWGRQAVATLAAATLATLLWEGRRALARTLTSLPFSVALLALLLGTTAIGTVILQQATREEYVERHGAVLASLLLTLGMDDLFHTVWFTGLLALLAVSLLLTVVANRAWKLPMWGHLLSHLGVVTILLGGWIGSRYGFKGFIDLHAGQSVGEARRLGPRGIPGEAVPLGFSVRLEDFAVEHYKPGAKFYVRGREKFRRGALLDMKEVGA